MCPEGKSKLEVRSTFLLSTGYHLIQLFGDLETTDFILQITARLGDVALESPLKFTCLFIHPIAVSCFLHYIFIVVGHEIAILVHYDESEVIAWCK